jgi:predicted aldo/keto reductase-like oxidoreductase
LATFAIPDDTPLEQAVFTEPLGCCVRAMERYPVGPADVAVLIGAASIGLLFIQLVKLAGARVVVSDIAGRRHEIILATKSLRRDATGAREDLETSLRLLGTDYVDIWQIHYLNTEAEREQALGPGGALEAAVKARDEGWVRPIGVTGHDWLVVGKAVSTGAFDMVLCWHNAAMPEPEELVFPQAVQHDVGVVIMRTTGTDKLLEGADAPPPETFYRYVLQHPAVSVALMGPA